MNSLMVWLGVRIRRRPDRCGVAGMGAVLALYAHLGSACIAQAQQTPAGTSETGAQAVMVVAKLLDGEVPATDPTAPAWETAPVVEFPLSAQVNWDPRIFKVTVRSMTVRALHNQKKIAFLLEYADPTQDLGDAAALEFPVGDAKPHFAHAQRLAQMESGSVNIWHWKAQGQTATDLTAQGFGTLTRQERQDPVGQGIWKDGRWRVVFSRSLATGDPHDAEFVVGKPLLFAMAAWDGGNVEHGAQKAVSSWYYVAPEAPLEPGMIVYPATAAFVVVGLEVFLIRRFRKAAFLLLLIVVAAAFASPGFAAEQATGSAAYREFPLLGSRNMIWLTAQLHLLFAGFVLGVPIFAWICELVGILTQDLRYDWLARAFTKLLIAAFGTTATFGGALLFLLVALYPKFFNVLTEIFYPTYFLYAGLFFAETTALYLYWYGWDAMAHRKGLHLAIGFLLNLTGTLLMMIANSWATFQASPVFVSGSAGTWRAAWQAVNNFTWMPLNIHRLLANVALGGFICAAYAGFRYLAGTSDTDRERYDWMGHVGTFIGTFALLPLPFAGYWLTREIYLYNQQMGITLMGGFLSWLFILQAILIGALFLGVNYYLWLGLAYRTDGAERYRKFILAMLVTLAVCIGVWVIPHSLVASMEEAVKMGGTHHPVLGVLGLMSAKMTAANIMILVTFISFLLYWRANREETVRWAPAGKIAQAVIIAAAIAYVVWLGVYGYFVPVIVRIGFSVNQVLAVLATLAVVTVMTTLMLRNAAHVGSMQWGRMPARAQYVLILIAADVILLMSMMGYARSASRTHWHIYGMMRDSSPHAFSPSLGDASLVIVACSTLFCLIVSFIFWVASLPGRAPVRAILAAQEAADREAVAVIAAPYKSIGEIAAQPEAAENAKATT